MQRIRPLAQHYDQYKPEDFTVWHLLYERQMKQLRKYASTSYLEALEKVGFSAERIPDFEVVNKKLATLTGWQLTVVPGLVPKEAFFKLLSQKVFPCTCWLRTLAEIDYIEEPDMFHDVFGHVPLLANKEYAAFMQAFGELSLKWMGKSRILNVLSRLYWFTIEFGLIREDNGNRIYGAGILSSPGETIHSMSEKSTRRIFDIEGILDSDYRTDILQEQYFVIDSFKQLYDMLPIAEKRLIKTAIDPVPC